MTRRWDLFKMPPEETDEQRRAHWPTTYIPESVREAFLREPVCLYCGGLLVGGTVHGPGRGEVQETDPSWCDVSGPWGICRTEGCQASEAAVKARRGRLDLVSPPPSGRLPVRPLLIPQGDDIGLYRAPDGGPVPRYLRLLLKGITPAVPHNDSRFVRMGCETWARVPHCKDHGRGVLSERYDAYYCQPCDGWLEEPCGDKACFFCPERPARPSGT